LHSYLVTFSSERLSSTLSNRLSSLFFFFLLYIVSVASYTPFEFLQYLSELAFLWWSLHYIFARRLKNIFFIPLSIVLLVSLVCFPLQPLVSSLNSFRLLLTLTLSLLLASTSRFDEKFLLRIVDLFFLLDVVATLFLPSSFLFPITVNSDLMNSGAGGLFLSFHLNGYLLGLWLFYHTLTRPAIFLLSIPLLLYTQSKQSVVFYIVAVLFYCAYQLLFKSKKRLKNIPPRLLLCLFPLFFVSSLFILLISIPPEILISMDPSVAIIYQQFFQMGSLWQVFLPSDIYSFYDLYYNYDGGLSIANEISLFDFIYRYGLISTFILFYLLSVSFPALISFILLPLAHYSYLYSPLTFLLFRRVNSRFTRSFP